MKIKATILGVLSSALVVLGCSCVFAQTPPPEIYSVSPNIASLKTTSVDITDLEGANFWEGITVKLSKTGQSDIIASNVTVLADYMLICTFDLTGAVAGAYDVVVINPDGQSATLPQSFTFSQDDWVAAAPMSHARTGHAAAQLRDGKILVTGGMDADGNVSASTEMYDPATDSWSDAGSLSHARSGHTATVMSNDKVLVAGGSDSNGYVVDAEVYDPFTRLWTMTVEMLRGHFGHTATLLNNGKVLISGGDHFSATNMPINLAEQYDSDTGSWSEAGSIEGRLWHTATPLADGRVLLAGGTDTHGPTSSSQIYDSVMGLWTQGGYMSSSHSNHTATLLPDATVLVAEGGNPAEIYNPITYSWTQTPDLLGGVLNATSMLLPTGNVLVAGGQDANNNAEIYDTTSASWRPTAPMLQQRTNHISALLPNGKVLVAGGQNSDGTLLSSAEIFEPYGPQVLTNISIMPNNASGDSVKITNLYGTGFASGAAVKLTMLGEQDITASDITVVNPDKILCTLDLSNAASGHWDVTVANTDGHSTTLPGAFTVSPSITSITPNIASGSADIDVYLEGRRFAVGATVKLSKSDQADVYASNVTVLADNMITCTLPVSSAAEDVWDVVVTNPNGSFATLAKGFTTGGSWLTTASMPQEREYHTATFLPNGTVLVAGGYNANGTLGSTLIYDTASGTWKTTGDMVIARAFHNATLLPNGKVLAVGGYDANSNLLDSSEVYDPATGIWTTTGSLSSGRAYNTITLLLNGKVLVSGGYGWNLLSSAETYNIATGSWTVAGSLSQARYGHAATLLSDGRVMVSGGAGADGGSLASAEVYNPATDSWASAGSLTQGRTHHASVLLQNGQVLVSGGSDDNWGTIFNSAELYDPAINNWTVTESLLDARFSHAATVLSNGKVMVSGGSSYYWIGTLASAEVYNSTAATWSYTSFMSQPRTLHTATVLSNGNVLAVGGESSGNTLASAEIYQSTDASAPKITAISVSSAPNTANLDQFGITGTGFSNGISIRLTSPGQPAIVATNVVVLSPVQLTCTLPITNAASGVWSIVVVNANGQSAILPNAFTITSTSIVPVPGSSVAQSTATLSNTTSLSATLRTQDIALTGVISTGTLAGTVAYTGFTLTTVHTGGFDGKGFARSAWTATLGGVNYSGQMKAMVFYTSAIGKMYLKGATTGDITGTFDGYLSETSPGSGVYNSCSVTWIYNRLKTSSSIGALYLSGGASINSTQDYPNVPMKLVQENVAGNATGYISGSLNATLTHLRVDDPTNPYNGEGYLSLSYIDNQGSGSGWTYAKKPASGPLQLNGFLSAPTDGIATGTLNDTVAPNTLTLNIEHINPNEVKPSEIEVHIFGPSRVSVGSTVIYRVTLKNKGVLPITNMSLKVELPELVSFVSASEGGNYNKAFRKIWWPVNQLNQDEEYSGWFIFKWIESSTRSFRINIKAFHGNLSEDNDFYPAMDAQGSDE